MELKEKLLQACKNIVEQRLQNIEKTITSHQNSLNAETKSSAGDKHETGRAMLQLEMEKAGKQLQSIQEIQETLSKIDSNVSSKIVCLGSIIQTDSGNYFLSSSIGQIQLEKEVYFAISTASPIGKLLLGKQIGESVKFNEKTIKIQFVN